MGVEYPGALLTRWSAASFASASSADECLLCVPGTWSVAIAVD
jgi:hypothetical protein